MTEIADRLATIYARAGAEYGKFEAERAAYTKGAESMQPEIDALAARVARLEQAVTKAKARVQPILDRTANQVGTHTLDGSCAQYHVGCLAHAVRAALTTSTRTEN